MSKKIRKLSEPKKTTSFVVRETVELLEPTRTVPNMSEALGKLVEQKIAEMMTGGEDSIFEPFFRAQAIAQAIKRQETVPQQNKWIYFFEDWGCMVCGRKNRQHSALGMCGTCYSRIAQRLKSSLRRAEADKPGAVQVVRDLTDLARASLRRRS
jgi:hypothetical protein